MTERKRYQGGFIRYSSSHDGTARFEACLSRTTRKGTYEHLSIDLELTRSDLRCIIKAMKEFADAERTAIANMPI